MQWLGDVAALEESLRHISKKKRHAERASNGRFPGRSGCRRVRLNDRMTVVRNDSQFRYSAAMAVRPTESWREGIAEEVRELASGELDAECAVMARLFPESLLVRTDKALLAFETEVAGLNRPSDEEIFGVIERVVFALNAVNNEHDGAAYETGEREQLCRYIDESLTEAGIDVAALASRRGIKRYEITDEWRRW